MVRVAPAQVASTKAQTMHPSLRVVLGVLVTLVIRATKGPAVSMQHAQRVPKDNINQTTK